MYCSVQKDCFLKDKKYLSINLRAQNGYCVLGNGILLVRNVAVYLKKGLKKMVCSRQFLGICKKGCQNSFTFFRGYGNPKTT